VQPNTQRTQRTSLVSFGRRLCLFAVSLTLSFSAHAQSQPQFRAAWADIFHNGLTSGADVTNMVNTLASANYNVVIAQVLGYMDNSIASHGAHWKSSIVPQSSRVTANFDPLAVLCTYAHSKGIEVHAWLGGSGGGPYRVSTSWPVTGNSTLSAHPEWFMVPYTNSEANASNPLDGSYLLDMGSPDAQEYIVSIVKELVTNYQIDGINWDDEINGTGYNQGYGYPAYSTSTYAKSGLARYRAMTGNTGTPVSSDTTWSNYRRRFRNELMARCQAEIQSIKTNPRQPLRHTTAPEAYSPTPTTCTFSSTKPYADLIDWAAMLQNGWVDAVIPQTYSISTFTNWADKCSTCWQYNRAIFPGMGGYLNSNVANLNMMKYAYSIGLQGTSIYSYAVPNNSATPSDWWNFIASNLYTNSVPTPPMPWRDPATATEGIMWGRVKDNVSGLYVDDATVTIAGGSTVKTDGNGYYVATLVPATASGTVHQIVASKTGMYSATNSTATAVAADVMRYDITINVTPGPVTYTLSVGGVGSGSVSASPSQASYTSNSVVTLTATPGAGKRFMNWFGDASGTNNPLSVTMNANKSISAVFSDAITDIIVDNADAAAAFTGSWTTSSATTPFYGSNYSFASTTTGSATATATYRPTIYAAGRYDVYVFFTSSGNRATNAPFTLQHNGVADSLTLDESVNGANVNGGNWTLLAASKSFASGTNDYVYFANNAQASKVVMGDAIKWAYSAVQTAPVITNDPQNVALRSGNTAIFTAGASGDSIAWSWYKNSTPLSDGGNISGATTSSLTISSASQADAASYTAVASNIISTATSSPATLTVYDPPSITSQPQSETTLQGGTVFFAVSATGSQPLTYQWRKDNVNLVNDSNIAGATTPTLTIRSAGASNLGTYTATVSNLTGVAVSSAAVTLTIVSNQIPLLNMASNVDGSISTTWQTDAGTSYTLQYKSNLTDFQWTTINTVTAGSSSLTLSDVPNNASQRFYQLVSSTRASNPAGYVKLSLLGNSDSFVSLPFICPGATRAIVESVSGNVITVSGAPGWTANQFVYASGTQSNHYYACFVSGAIEGRLYPVTANGTDTVTLNLGADTLSGIVAGDVFSIEPYWTLATTFPNGAGVLTSPTPGNRYTEILTPSFTNSGINLSAAKISYYNGGTWKQVSDGAVNHNDDIILPNTHFIVRHNVSTNTTLTLMGSVATTKLAINLQTQTTTDQDNYIGLMRPAAVSLTDSGLINSGAFAASPLPGSRTDELLVFDNTTANRNKSASAVYYYWNNAWRQVGAGSTDVGANLIFQPGTGVIIRKDTTNAIPTWINAPNW
jgi:uncharacterized protein (TIGR02597 family)